eukprot:m51a1_g7380 hypothetical protein (1135) ;mRNA; f:97200-101122
MARADWVSEDAWHAFTAHARASGALVETMGEGLARELASSPALGLDPGLQSYVVDRAKALRGARHAPLPEEVPGGHVNLVVVGHAGAGKTSVLRRVAACTRKTSLFSLRKSGDTGSDAQASGTVPTRISLCKDVTTPVVDMPGQMENARSVELFFAAERAIYLLVVDGAAGAAEAEAQLRHWLHVLWSQARGPPGPTCRLVVACSKSDALLQALGEGAPRMREEQLRAALGRWAVPKWLDAQVLCVTASDPRGCDNLLATLRRHAKDVGAAKIPRLFAAASRAVEAAAKAGSSGPFSSTSQFKMCLPPELVVEADGAGLWEALLEYLHDTGQVVADSARDVVCLDPQLLSRILCAFQGDWCPSLTASTSPVMPSLLPPSAQQPRDPQQLDSAPAAAAAHAHAHAHRKSTGSNSGGAGGSLPPAYRRDAMSEADALRRLRAVAGISSSHADLNQALTALVRLQVCVVGAFPAGPALSPASAATASAAPAGAPGATATATAAAVAVAAPVPLPRAAQSLQCYFFPSLRDAAPALPPLLPASQWDAAQCRFVAAVVVPRVRTPLSLFSHLAALPRVARALPRPFRDALLLADAASGTALVASLRPSSSLRLVAGARSSVPAGSLHQLVVEACGRDPSRWPEILSEAVAAAEEVQPLCPLCVQSRALCGLADPPAGSPASERVCAVGHRFPDEYLRRGAPADPALAHSSALWSPAPLAAFLAAAQPLRPLSPTQRSRVFVLADNARDPVEFAEYARARALFYDALAAEDRGAGGCGLELVRVAVCRNLALEEAFWRLGCAWAERLASGAVAPAVAHSPDRRPWREWVLSRLAALRRGASPAAPVLGWSAAASEAAAHAVAESNYALPPEAARQSDPGPWGQGIYFSLSPQAPAARAGERAQAQAQSREAVLVASWLALGNAYAVTEDPRREGSVAGKQCVAGFDSHVCVTSLQSPAVPHNPFAPEAAAAEAAGLLGTAVVFSPNQVLPRYIYVVREGDADSGGRERRRDASAVVLWVDDRMSQESAKAIAAIESGAKYTVVETLFTASELKVRLRGCSEDVLGKLRVVVACGEHNRNGDSLVEAVLSVTLAARRQQAIPVLALGGGAHLALCANVYCAKETQQIIEFCTTGKLSKAHN